MKKRTIEYKIADVVLILGFAFLLSILGFAIAEAKDNLRFYNKLADDLSIVEVCDSKKLTGEMLRNRNGHIIIEKTIGKVTNDDLDGRILNYISRDYDYISYKNVEGAKKGDIILTYSIYNPDTDYEDDIIARYDYIIDRAQ